jgi:hypothetical protein
METADRQKVKFRNGGVFRLAVLVPHRDIRPALNSFRRRLFAAGIPGAYALPPAVPLALLEKPLGDPELKALAVSLRALSLEPEFEPAGVFTAADGPPALIDGPGGLAFWGLSLGFSPGFPALFGALRGIPFPQAALCAALAGNDPDAEREIFLKTGNPPSPRFRAAAAANLTVKFFFADGRAPDKEDALSGLSSRWRIGKPCWLRASGR